MTGLNVRGIEFMTDNVVQDTTNVTDTVAPSSELASIQPISTEVIQEQKKERLFTRDEVAKIANTERNKAIEAMKGTMQQEIQAGLQSAIKQAAEFKAKQEVEAQRKEIDAKNIAVANAFKQKLDSAKDSFPDVAATAIPLIAGVLDINTVSALNESPYTAEIVNELISNPSRLSAIAGLQSIDGSTVPLIKKEIERLATQIEGNKKKVSSIRISPAPLSEIKPEIHSADSDSSSWRDLHAKYGHPVAFKKR